MIIVAKRLPEARLILLDQAQAAHPLGTLPEVEVRYQQAGRPTVLRLQGLAFIGVDDPGLPSCHLVQRQVGGIASIAKRRRQSWRWSGPAASRVSRETPSQCVSSFDHLVTQWMSLVTVSRGRA